MLSCDQNTFINWIYFACNYTSLFLIPMAKKRENSCCFNTLSNNCFIAKGESRKLSAESSFSHDAAQNNARCIYH